MAEESTLLPVGSGYTSRPTVTYVRRVGADSWSIRLEGGKLEVSGGDHADAYGPVQIDEGNWPLLMADIGAVIKAAVEV